MKTDNKKEIFVNLNNVKLKVEFFKYSSGRKGFRLLNPEDNKQVTVCTVDLEKCKVNKNEVLIKDYNENKGLYYALLKCGFIHPYKRSAAVGLNKAYVCNLNMDYKNVNKKDLIIIAAVGLKKEIGKNNDLIWHLPNDLKRFKSLTNNHNIIMGRKTFESLPFVLPNRKHIVITRNKDYKVPEGVIVVNSVKEAVNYVGLEKSFIIGGGQIYKEFLKMSSTLELTIVNSEFKDADTFFPDIDLSLFELTNVIENEIDEKHKYQYSFVTYKKI